MDGKMNVSSRYGQPTAKPVEPRNSSPALTSSRLPPDRATMTDPEPPAGKPASARQAELADPRIWRGQDPDECRGGSAAVTCAATTATWGVSAGIHFAAPVYSAAACMLFYGAPVVGGLAGSKAKETLRECKHTSDLTEERTLAAASQFTAKEQLERIVNNAMACNFSLDAAQRSTLVNEVLALRGADPSAPDVGDAIVRLAAKDRIRDYEALTALSAADLPPGLHARHLVTLAKAHPHLGMHDQQDLTDELRQLAAVADLAQQVEVARHSAALTAHFGRGSASTATQADAAPHADPEETPTPAGEPTIALLEDLDEPGAALPEAVPHDAS